MATLSSASTLAEIKAAYDDNCSYVEDGSIAKARAFVTACKMLARYVPSRAASGSVAVVEFDSRLYERQADEATEWLAAVGGLPNPGADGQAVTTSFEGFRD